MFENHQKMSYCLTPSFNFQKLATLAKLANFDSFNWLLSTQCSQCWMRLFLCFSNIVSIIKSRVLCEFQSETLSVTHPSFKSLDEGRRKEHRRRGTKLWNWCRNCHAMMHFLKEEAEKAAFAPSCSLAWGVSEKKQ